MKIQPKIPQYNNINDDRNQRNNQSFTGAMEIGTAFLRFLDTNQAWGANTVDLCSMVIPRTTVDFVNRGPEAGTETARRESMGTFNHSMVGVYGSLAGALLATSLNNRFGIKAHKIFADNETFETITKSFDENKGSDYKAHLKNIFSKLETEVDGELRKIPANDVEKLAEKFNSAIMSEQSPEVINKELKNYSKALISYSTGSQNSYRFAGSRNTFTLTSAVENIYNVTKAVVAKEAKGVSTADFLRSMKRMNIQRSIVGLSIASAVGMLTQPINMYLTKKKTGSDGFVGVAGREKDKSAQFKVFKAVGASIFTLGAISTITTNPKNLLTKLQFKGMIPTMSQLKLVYGLTIASRLLSARDKDEFRESLTKDSLGFLNLLVLGSLVTKGVARVFDKSLINVSKENSKNFLKWLTHSSLKTRDEILYTELKNRGVATIRDGKELPFKELLKLADKSTKGKLRILNVAQIAGYLYSGLVLGIGVPKLNIYMTNKSEAKRKAKLAEKEAQNNTSKVESNKDVYANMIKPDSVSYLSKSAQA
jgi:hypothetical protein